MMLFTNPLKNGIYIYWEQMYKSFLKLINIKVKIYDKK